MLCKDSQGQAFQILFAFLEELYYFSLDIPFERHLLICLRKWGNYPWLVYTLPSREIITLYTTEPDCAHSTLIHQACQQYLPSREQNNHTEHLLKNLAILAKAEDCMETSAIQHVFLPLSNPSTVGSIQNGIFLSYSDRYFTYAEQQELVYLRSHLCRAQQAWQAQALEAAAAVKKPQETPRTIEEAVKLLQSLGLTRRQAEVMVMVAQGKDNNLIAQQLKCSIKTVKKHLENIYLRLGVTTRAKAVSKALEKTGFIQDHYPGPITQSSGTPSPL
jgi:DNA-binding CsgD family transcriptional regulator